MKDRELYSNWEMFWPCAVVVIVCTAPLSWAFGPLIMGWY